jgi:HlyD family secretion protein
MKSTLQRCLLSLKRTAAKLSGLLKRAEVSIGLWLTRLAQPSSRPTRHGWQERVGALKQSVAMLLLSLFRRRLLLYSVLALAAFALLVVTLRSTSPARAESTFYEVKRGACLISMVEGGSIEAVNEEVIRNEVDGTLRIIFIVKEGASVKKGDLLVEFDSAVAMDEANAQQIVVERAQFAHLAAEQQLQIQKSTVDSEIITAQIRLEFAKSDLDKYIKGEAQQARRNAQIEITNVLEMLQIAEERLGWTEDLYKKNFETKGNLDKDRLAVSQNRLKLEQTRQALWMFETFDMPKRKRELEAAFEEAKESLERVKRQGENKLAQGKADVQTQKSTLELNKAKLARNMKTLQAMKIYAPQDGLVVYAGGVDRRYSTETVIEEGAMVRKRQEIIKLPDVSEMKLTVKVHESHVNQVRPGQAAYIVLDALPDKRFRGHVNWIAPLPDSSSLRGDPNLKVYLTEVRITDPLPNVKPGVSARAEIVVTNLENALTVPIQAVTTRMGQQVVFLAESPTKPVPVSLGLFNTKLIEITSGVKEGDRVLLSPPFGVEKNLGGAIIAVGDTLPPPAAKLQPPPVETERPQREKSAKRRKNSAESAPE